MSEQYFAWDEDVAIPFRTNEAGDWVVNGESLVRMAQSVIWNWAQGDASPIGPLLPVDVINDISHLFSLYRVEADEAILDSSGSYPLCDPDGRPICKCGHAVSGHQTGDGPWTGFCGWADDDGNQCKCESPEEEL